MKPARYRSTKQTLLALCAAGLVVLAGCSEKNSGHTVAGGPVAPGSSGSQSAPQGAAAPAPGGFAPAPDASTATPGAPATSNAGNAPAPATGGTGSATPAKNPPSGAPAAASKPAASGAKDPAASGAKSPAAATAAAPTPSAAAQAPPGGNGGATDVGVSDTEIKLGSIWMYGHPFGKLAIQPMYREVEGFAKAINDSGGIYGRKLKTIDCDDGAPDPARTRACYKKLLEQDKIFAGLGSCTFAENQWQADQQRDRLPWMGSCGFYRETWDNPFSFPIHMDMAAEARANAAWVRDTQKVKTFGLICLKTPGMINACNQAQKVLEQSGAKLVFRREFEPNVADMSGDILAARTAAPDHILHYTVDPTIHLRFMVDAAQQDYWPPKGISGNHMAIEFIGDFLGEYPAKKGYWTNTTYKLWGSDYIAFMARYAPSTNGVHTHVNQGMWFGGNALAEAMRAVGPNLTRDALVKALYGREWDAGPELSSKFMWEPSKRSAEGTGNRQEYMYKYVNTNTKADPKASNASSPGLVPDPTQFVIKDEIGHDQK